MQRRHQNDPTGMLEDRSKAEHGDPIKIIRFPGEISSPREVKPRKYQDSS